MNTRFLLLAVPLLMCASQSMATDYPDIKAGLWSTSINLVGQGTHTGTMCMNNDVLKAQAESIHGGNGSCKVLSENHSGSTFSSKSQCTFGDVTHIATAVTTMTGNTGMHAELTGNDGKMQMVSDSKYVSACPAGMVPGDFVDEQGHKMNMLASPPAASGNAAPNAPK